MYDFRIFGGESFGYWYQHLFKVWSTRTNITNYIWIINLESRKKQKKRTTANSDQKNRRCWYVEVPPHDLCFQSRVHHDNGFRCIGTGQNGEHLSYPNQWTKKTRRAPTKRYVIIINDSSTLRIPTEQFICARARISCNMLLSSVLFSHSLLQHFVRVYLFFFFRPGI